MPWFSVGKLKFMSYTFYKHSDNFKVNISKSAAACRQFTREWIFLILGGPVFTEDTVSYRLQASFYKYQIFHFPQK